MSSCRVVNNIAWPFEHCAMSDEMLVAAAQAGQDGAFAELCRRSSKRVFTTIYRMTKNREDAEDVLQDSIMRAFRHLKTFDGRSSFATWFTRIGINSALMILRKRRLHFEISMDAMVEGEAWQAGQIADYSLDPEQRCAGRERALHLRRAVRDLPHSLRSVVERDLQEQSMNQIASEMAISKPAVKSRLSRAKALLRKSMRSAPAGSEGLRGVFTQRNEGDAGLA